MAPKRNDKYTRWKCKCSCGNIVEVRGDYLISGHTTSCGCQKGKRELPNHIGEKFGDWTIISKGTKTSYWLCKCSCGIEREVFYPSLQKGLSTSCGHKNKELKGPRKSINGNRYGNLVVIE